jgi:Tol biopolymer transport system component
MNYQTSGSLVSGVSSETETFVKEITEPSTAVTGVSPLTPDKLYVGSFKVAHTLPEGEKPYLVCSAIQEGDTFFHLWKKIIPAGVDSGLVKITADQYNDVCPVLFPDNKMILFSSARLGHRQSMWKCNISGLGGVTKVVGADVGDDILADISPDGKKIVFVSATVAGMEISGYRYENMMWIINTDGSELTQLRIGDCPRWSPDGTKIAFNYNGDIWIINTDGSDVTKLTNKGGIQPYWSPDGTRICFASYQGNTGNKNWDIWKINIDGSDLSQLTCSKATDIAPVWSTQEEIYFSSNRGYEKSGQYRIWKMKLATAKKPGIGTVPPQRND